MIRSVLCLAAIIAAPLTAQDGDQHLLVFTGLSGEPYFEANFASTAGLVVEAATRAWKLPAGRITWLAESAESRHSGRATKSKLDSVFARLAVESRPGDVVTIFIVGHGSGQGEQSKLSLPGPDPTAADLSRWLDLLDGRTLVVILGASAAGDFLPVISSPGRIIMSATKSSTERNESLFASRFAHGLASLEADGDKDGLVSALEAFNYAQREVAAAYESDGRLMTEHAQLDDNGDGRGSAEPGQDGVADGALARRVTFGRLQSATDPRLAALFDSRRKLEDQVEALRRRKDSMSEASYYDELERLLLAIAEKTEAIRAVSEPSQ